MKPYYKSEHGVLYNADCLELMSELEEKYCEIAAKRLEETSKQGILPGFKE